MASKTLARTPFCRTVSSAESEPESESESESADRVSGPRYHSEAIPIALQVRKLTPLVSVPKRRRIDPKASYTPLASLLSASTCQKGFMKVEATRDKICLFQEYYFKFTR
nr:uncharacterized protein LOC111998641 [Quercus suber]POE68344.1 hypothetical protein CFP56_12517 [Quercus suber]